jgi:hypothetical protein
MHANSLVPAHPFNMNIVLFFTLSVVCASLDPL